MYQLNKLAKEYGIEEEILQNYCTTHSINTKKTKTCIQQLLPFIEAQTNRKFSQLPESNFSIQYENKEVSIYKDDAISFLQKLPSNSIDIIVTDPAYSGMNNQLKLGKGRIVGKYSEKGQENGKWFDEFQDSVENYSIFLNECQRVLKKSTGHIYIMFDSYSLLSLGNTVRSFFDVKNIITWDKVNIGMGHYYRRRHEYIIFATNGNTRKIKNRSFPDVWRFKRIHNASYPTQKPVELFQAMIYASTEEGFTVCDPFLGSGSSAVAAIKNKCNFIGCDISDKSINTVQSRLNEFINTNTDPIQKNSAVVDKKVFWE